MEEERTIEWKEPWYLLDQPSRRRGLARELALEVGPLHPIWGTDPVVLGTRDDCDDIVVSLSGGRFAIVHLIWHGAIDQFPDRYPSTKLFADAAAFQRQIDADADDWEAGAE
jgi:hypothetical protein